jgi:predicted nucleic acid-binding protein
MLYVDTSFLAPLTLPEATSEAIAAFVRDLNGDELTVSRWTEVEFCSLLAREVRMGGLDRRAAVQAATRFEAMLSGSFSIILPLADDFSLARQNLGKFATGLRAGDAFHLAIASNHRARTVYSLDKAMVRAGEILGIPVSVGIQTK